MEGSRRSLYVVAGYVCVCVGGKGGVGGLGEVREVSGHQPKRK